MSTLFVPVLFFATSGLLGSAAAECMKAASKEICTGSEPHCKFMVQTGCDAFDATVGCAYINVRSESCHNLNRIGPCVEMLTASRMESMWECDYDNMDIPEGPGESIKQAWEIGQLKLGLELDGCKDTSFGLSYWMFFEWLRDRMGGMLDAYNRRRGDMGCDGAARQGGGLPSEGNSPAAASNDALRSWPRKLYFHLKKQ